MVLSEAKSDRNTLCLIKFKLRSFKSSEHINEKGDGPYRGFDYKSLVSDPLEFGKMEPKRITETLQLSTG